MVALEVAVEIGRMGGEIDCGWDVLATVSSTGKPEDVGEETHDVCGTHE